MILPGYRDSTAGKACVATSNLATKAEGCEREERKKKKKKSTM